MIDYNLRKNKQVSANTSQTSYFVATSKYTQNGQTFTNSYTYDKNGNITGISKSGSASGNTSYVYDGQNRLIRENNSVFNKTYTYEYDASGNITSRKEYNYTTGSLGSVTATANYTYSNGFLTSYNGQTCGYDEMGYPTMYKGQYVGYVLGRLAEYGNATFEYGYDGLRTSKYVGGVNTTYYYVNGKLLGEKRGSTNIQYVYDANGIAGMVYGGYDYVFRKDIQGNVVAIYRGNTLMAQYEYDAWGRCKIVSESSGIGSLNPFRYRGYYYDSETGLYYLRTRYYDPETGRWLSPDKVTLVLGALIINGINPFSYCFNDPVNYVDYGGCFPQWNRGWWEINKRLKYRFDEDHIHVKFGNEDYSWYEYSLKTHDSKTNDGYNNLANSAKKELKKNGVPPTYFEKISYVPIPEWREGFSIVPPDPWQEGFSITGELPHIEGIPLVGNPGFTESFSPPVIDQNTIVTIMVIAGVALAVLCIAGAFFTGGQSLWGLAAFI